MTSDVVASEKAKEPPRIFGSDELSQEDIELLNFTYYSRPIASWNPKCNEDPESSIETVYEQMAYSIKRNDKLSFDAIIM